MLNFTLLLITHHHIGLPDSYYKQTLCYRIQDVSKILWLKLFALFHQQFMLISQQSKGVCVYLLSFELNPAIKEGRMTWCDRGSSLALSFFYFFFIACRGRYRKTRPLVSQNGFPVRTEAILVLYITGWGKPYGTVPLRSRYYAYIVDKSISLSVMLSKLIDSHVEVLS